MFEPYTSNHGIGNLRFFCATEKGKSWYDPMKPVVKLEYEWVMNNIDMTDKCVIDAGCHHGHYALIFNKAKAILCVDEVQKFVDIAIFNVKLNNFGNYIFQVERLDGKPWITIPSFKPDIYKMDIEGWEFKALPEEMKRFPNVSTWIVEIHPGGGNPEKIINMFIDNGYRNLLKVDRLSMEVRPYKLQEKWLFHATLIARK